MTHLIQAHCTESSKEFKYCYWWIELELRLLTPKADLQGAGGAHDLTIGRPGANSIDCVDQIDRCLSRWCQRHHNPISLSGDMFHRTGAKTGAQMAIPGGGAAATLQVTKYNRTGFLTCTGLDFAGDPVSNAAQASFACP